MTRLWTRRLALSLLLATPLMSTASDWPSKPLRLIVGFPAGSSPDLTARALAEPLGRALGQAVVVENKVGAGGNIAADAVAKATDGHTLGIGFNGPLAYAPFLYAKTPYDPAKDEKLPWEDEVRAAIEKLREEKEAKKREDESK